MKKLKLEVGTKFGKWEVVKEKTKKKNNVTHWYCRCECGVEQYVPLNNLMNKSSTQCNYCAKTESGKKKRKGCGDISGDMWSQFLKKSKKKNSNVSIRVEQAWDLFLQQDKKCALSGLPIELSGYPYDRKKTTAVLMRMDTTDGFRLDNLYWVHKDIDKMRGDLSFEDFTSYIWKIVDEQAKAYKEEYNEKHLI